MAFGFRGVKFEEGLLDFRVENLKDDIVNFEGGSDVVGIFCRPG